MKEGGFFYGTPLHPVRRSGRSSRRYPASSLWNGAVDFATVLFLPLTTQPAGGRKVVLSGRRPDCPLPPPRAGDTLKPWNNKVTKYGGMR